MPYVINAYMEVSNAARGDIRGMTKMYLLPILVNTLCVGYNNGLQTKHLLLTALIIKQGGPYSFALPQPISLKTKHVENIWILMNIYQPYSKYTRLGKFVPRIYSA